MKYPFWGSRSLRDELRGRGYSNVGRGHVSTMMKKMGIEALYKKPRLSSPHPEHKIYLYLLRGLEITRANHVWATDITYRVPSPWKRGERRYQGLSMSGMHKGSYMEDMDQMPAFRYGKARAEAAVICRTLAE
jgi:putative transposase